MAHVQTVVEYLAQLEDQSERTAQLIRTALRWFFQTAAPQSGLMVVSPSAPVIQVEKLDAGWASWEKRLVAVLRTRQVQYRKDISLS